jgi:hypothetical protein
MAESLRQKQSRFVKMLARLIDFAYAEGYELTIAEAYRPPAQARKGGSLHSHRLAVDLNLFRNGKYLTATGDHLPLGEFWESIGGAWGGRFNDGNHYSLAHAGLK